MQVRDRKNTWRWENFHDFRKGTKSLGVQGVLYYGKFVLATRTERVCRIGVFSSNANRETRMDPKGLKTQL